MMTSDSTKVLHFSTFLLTVIGALNWGLVGAFDFNLVTQILGNSPSLVKAVYILIGLSGLVFAISHINHCSALSNSYRSE
jgi:uncharacterized membrane protein YuzA (DUF378 family)